MRETEVIRRALVTEKTTIQREDTGIIVLEVAMAQMDVSSVFIATGDSQLSRGEPVEDTARVLSRMVDCIAMRTSDHGRLERFARHSRVPVINALSNDFHPCQLLADMQTFAEHRGAIAGRTAAWVGDGNNVCQSWINAAAVFDFSLRLCCPAGFEPDAQLLAANADRVSLWRRPEAAVTGAGLVVTDVWASMGQEEENAARREAFAGYQVDAELMAKGESPLCAEFGLERFREGRFIDESVAAGVAH